MMKPASLLFGAQLFLVSNLQTSSAFFVPPPATGREVTLRSSTEDTKNVGAKSDDFLSDFFESECNDVNLPRSLKQIMRSISQLASGSDIRGRFVDHPRLGGMPMLGRSIGEAQGPALTPFASYCLGHAFATMIKETHPEKEDIVICLGRDTRTHGAILADSFSRGAEGVKNVHVKYTGVATTPSMFEFCRSSLCDAAVMVTASHLPADKNGLKFFSRKGGFTNSQITTMINMANQFAQVTYDRGIIPATSGGDGVFCSEWVNWMPRYESSLKTSILKFVHGEGTDIPMGETLKGLKIVLNSGNGSGGFFHNVLESLGADVTASINIEADPTFPAGVPNPENDSMIKATIQACEAANADLGIMLDTDADRCGTIVPRTINEDGSCSGYEPLGRNRLIALMGVIFSKESPGCAIVTDSVTSEGLATFLQDNLGLKHVRYLKGYANVINKARSLTENHVCNAEVAIETSGHCALKENDYLDDGTYTAVRIIGLLARERALDPTRSLLDLIADLPEMEEEIELRMPLRDQSLGSTHRIFDLIASEIEADCATNGSKWELDTENLEGIRVSTGEGGFFMLRKSLHDPVLSLQVEATSAAAARKDVIIPLLDIFHEESEIISLLDFSAIENYIQ